MRFAQSVENSGLKDCRHTYEGVYIAERDEEILRLVMDLRVLNNILSRLPEKATHWAHCQSEQKNPDEPLTRLVFAFYNKTVYKEQVTCDLPACGARRE